MVQVERGPLLPKHLSASGVVKSAAGYLHRVIISYASPTAPVILYNNTAGSGTVIAKIYVDSANLAGVAADTKQVDFECDFSTGLYVDIPSGVTDVTVVYQ